MTLFHPIKSRVVSYDSDTGRPIKIPAGWLPFATHSIPFPNEGHQEFSKHQQAKAQWPTIRRIRNRKYTSPQEVVTTVYDTSIYNRNWHSADPRKLSFETVVLKGLAADGGLFLPHEIPAATEWVRTNDQCR
jgi:hypothetical protein